MPIPIERRLPVGWNQDNKTGDNKFPIQLRIEVIDRVGEFLKIFLCGYLIKV